MFMLGEKMLSEGSTITLNKTATKYIPGVWPGLSVRVRAVRDGGKTVGLHSPHERIDGWSDLDGLVNNRRGWWISLDQLEGCVDNTEEIVYEVKSKLEWRGTDLKGKPCRIIARFGDKKTVFVEFNEHVSGCSADGMGKAGYCVALNPNILTKKKREKHAK